MDFRVVEGHTALLINHGPFLTACTYSQACAEHEHTATHALFTQGAPAGAEYQALLTEMQGIIEHAIMLLYCVASHPLDSWPVTRWSYEMAFGM